MPRFDRSEIKIGMKIEGAALPVTRAWAKDALPPVRYGDAATTPLAEVRRRIEAAEKLIEDLRRRRRK
jgi:hypothetical protein